MKFNKTKDIFKKIAKIIQYIFLSFFVVMFLSLAESLLAVIFMIIKANNGYCSPFMLKIIEFEKETLRMWADS